MPRRAGGPADRRSGLPLEDGPPAGQPVASPGPLPACSPGRLIIAPPSAGPLVRRSALWTRLGRGIVTCAATFRRIVGMPDYAAYLQHLAERHPDWPVPSEREFYQLYIESRYGSGVSRCC